MKRRSTKTKTKTKTMQLPVGMLIFWIKRFNDDQVLIAGLWYYRNISVPSSVEDKKKSVQDLMNNQCCTLLKIHGTFQQTIDLISHSDKFTHAGPDEVSELQKLIDEIIINTAVEEVYLFDDIHNLKGTLLMIDTVLDVDQSLEEILAEIKEGNGVDVNISKTWSFAGDILNAELMF